MSVERLHSVAVVDHDIVAPTAVPAVTGVYDSATICGIDRASVACADVGAAVVFILACDGVGARTLTACYVGAVARPNEVTGADGAAAAVAVIAALLLLLLFVQL